MGGAYGPIEAAFVGFELGVVAALARATYATIPTTVARLGREGSRARRALGALAFLLGGIALFTPLGAVAALAGETMRYELWSAPGCGAVALACAALAASMLGAFPIAPGRAQAARLEAATSGQDSLEAAAARGFAIGLIGAPATAPFALGLASVVVTSGSAWTGAAALGAFALGLGALSSVAIVFDVTLPQRGAWNLAVEWLAGIALASLALLHVGRRSYAFDDLTREPGYTLGIVAIILVGVGLELGLLHVLAARPGSDIAHLSRALKLVSIVPAAVGAALLVSWAPHQHGSAPPVAWVTDEAAGRARAVAEQRPVIVVFNATWCCREVEHDMFFDPRVRDEAQRFVAIFVDASDDDAPATRSLQEKYRVVGLPTILMLDASGREVRRFNQILAPSVLAAAMRDVGRSRGLRFDPPRHLVYW